VRILATGTSRLRTTKPAAYAAEGNGDERPAVDDRGDRARRVMNRAAWGGRSGSDQEVSTVSEVPETPPTSFVIVELARPPRQAFRFAEQADALRLAERLRRADPDAAVRTETPEGARAVLLELAFVPEDAIGPLIIMESRHLDRETVEGHFRAVGGA
jgi:hypothetical protein